MLLAGTPGQGSTALVWGSKVWSQSDWTDWQKDNQVLSCLFVPFQRTLLPATVLRGSTRMLSSRGAGVVSQVWTWSAWAYG